MPCIASLGQSRGEPTIRQVYRAFDETADRVFRESVCLSSRGMVHVADLLLALFEHHRDLVAPVLATGWQPLRLTRPDHDSGIPMVNEPDLHALLVTAYRFALVQPAPGIINPAVLWGATLVREHMPWPSAWTRPWRTLRCTCRIARGHSHLHDNLQHQSIERFDAASRSEHLGCTHHLRPS